jgi:hypothetical protein
MSASPPSRISNVLFPLWIAGGVALVLTSWHYGDELWSKYHVETVFRFSNPTPEQRAREVEADRLSAILKDLEIGAVVYGLGGIVVFRRRGCSVVFVAGSIILLSGLAQFGST